MVLWPFRQPQRPPPITADDLAQGLVIARHSATGPLSHVLARGKAPAITLHYPPTRPGGFDHRTTRFGIYQRCRWFTQDPWPGNTGSIDLHLRFATLPPRPMPGMNWTVQATEVTKALSDQGIKGFTDTQSLTLTYRAGALTRLTLDRIPYAVFPVTAETLRDGTVCHHGFTCFADLGFGVETFDGAQTWTLLGLQRQGAQNA